MDRAQRLALLADEATACRLCPRMEGRCRVLGPGNGSVTARVLFVAEAPGRLGADRTGVPLSGDQSGRNFERLLAAAGLGRHEVFVTNAVLCNPRDDRGRNAVPSRAEVAGCSRFLRATLDLVRPEVVVALGVQALRALSLLEPHGLTLREDVGRPVPWRGCRLLPLYHPGPRAQLHRPLARQLEDVRVLARLLAGIPTRD